MNKMCPQIITAFVIFLILPAVAIEGASTDPLDTGFTEYSFSTRDKDFGLAADEQQGGAGLIAGTVRILNGNVVELRQDLSFASPHRLGLALAATYNSQSRTPGSMGYGWTHTYEVALQPAAFWGFKYICIVDDTGRAAYFLKLFGTLYVGMAGERSVVVADAHGYFWYRLDGLIYGFSSSGRLDWISDENQNRLELVYDAQARLSTVIDAASGRMLTFHYHVDHGFVEKISGPVTDAVQDGVWVRFGYENQNLTSVTYADDSGYRYDYTDTADAHNLTEKKDLAGHLIASWAFNSGDRCIEHFRASGNGVAIAYVDETRVEVTDAYGVLRSYRIGDVSGRKRVIAMEGKASPPYDEHNVVRWSYDKRMNLVAAEYANGTIFQYQNFDFRGNPRTVTHAVGTTEERVITYSYHPWLNVMLTRTEASVLGPGNKVTVWDYDNDDGAGEPNENPTGLLYRLLEQGFTHDQDGEVFRYDYVTVFTYNNKGQVASIDGPRANIDDETIFEYDPDSGDLVRITQPLIGAISFSEYDNAGQVKTIVDANGQAAHFDYDGRGRITTITHGADGSSKSLVFVDGLPDTFVDEDGVETGYEYDADFGRLYRLYDIENNYIQYVYDDQGNLEEKSRHDATGQRFSYRRWRYDGPDIPGKLWKQINFNDSYTEYRYYDNGNLKSETDAENHTTAYGYDALNRLRTVVQTDRVANDTVTVYGYDDHNNLTTVTDAEDHITRYTYDDMGRMVSSKSADMGTIIYVYDEVGNLIQKADANNSTTRYVYDDLNRLTDIQFVADASQNIDYRYDEGANGIGRRTGMSDPSGTTSFGYDARGRLVEKKSFVEEHEYILRRQYSPGGRLKTITYPSGHVIDLTGRHADTKKIKDISVNFTYFSLKLIGNLGYNPFSGAKEMDTGTGARIYNEQSECGCLQRSNPGASLEQVYTYDNNRNLTGIRGASVSWYDRDFVYDNLGRLEQAFGRYEEAGYDYDRVGNRLTRNIDGRIETYAYYPGTNRLELVSGSEIIGYGYDNNGNPTVIGNRTYEYNYNNRLVRVKEGNSTIADYTYNGLGQRMVKKAGDKQTVFLYDFDGQIIAESKPDGTYTAEYIYMGSTRLAKVDIKPNDALVYYYANNYLGTPFLMTDERGAVVWEAEYKPFGEARLNPNSKVENNFRFAGQYYDEETGLHYNYHRYYDPKTGRYLTPDPIGLDGGINPYIFAKNNPINWSDIDGAKPIFNSGVCQGGEIDPDALLFELYGIDVNELKKLAIQQQLFLISTFFPSGGFNVKAPKGWLREVFGKPYPSKLNRTGKFQPYDPNTGRYLAYNSNPGLKLSPFSRFIGGFSQGWAESKGASGATPVGRAGNIGYLLGYFIGNIF